MLSNSGGSLHMTKNGAFWLLIIPLAFHFISVCYSISTDNWVSIDCGNGDTLFDDHLVLWDTDDLYTDAGIDQRVRVKNQDQPLEILDTLRFFPSSSGQSCYKLPILKQKLRYLVRSGFLYGDYDGLNRPPVFDLLLDGKKMSKIAPASATEAIIDELVYTSEDSGVMNLCLAERKDGGVPFISSIQAVPTDDDLYSKMEMNETFSVVARINYGRDDEGFSFEDDDYERIWMSGTTPPNCNNISALLDLDSPENDPPQFVLEEAIESDNASSPIVLTVDFSRISSQPLSACFVLYFTEAADIFEVQNRTINILINGQQMSTITTDVNKCTVVTLYPVDVRESTANVTLVAANSSGLPPLISAMEVFSKVLPSGRAAGGPPVHLTFVSFVLLITACVLANLL